MGGGGGGGGGPAALPLDPPLVDYALVVVGQERTVMELGIAAFLQEFVDGHPNRRIVFLNTTCLWGKVIIMTK